MDSLVLNKIISYSDHGNWTQKIKTLNREYTDLYYWGRDYRNKDVLKHRKFMGVVYNWRIYPFFTVKEYNSRYGLYKTCINTGTWDYVPLPKNY